jgi:hypothetical protein
MSAALTARGGASLKMKFAPGLVGNQAQSTTDAQAAEAGALTAAVQAAAAASSTGSDRAVVMGARDQVADHAATVEQLAATVSTLKNQTDAKAAAVSAQATVVDAKATLVTVKANDAFAAALEAASFAALLNTAVFDFAFDSAPQETDDWSM